MSLSGLFISLSAAAPFVAQAQSDDVQFSPRKDAADIPLGPKKPTAAPPKPTRREFSFLRYEGAFRSLCDAIALDGRRERLVDVGRKAFAQEAECLACKALWRTILAGCSPRGDRQPAPRSLARRTPAEGSSETPTPVPSVYSVGERLPCVEAVDAASEISDRMHKDEPGAEPNLLALKRVFEQLTQEPSLSPAERDYYSVLGEYLCSAWQGRQGVSSH